MKMTGKDKREVEVKVILFGWGDEIYSTRDRGGIHKIEANKGILLHKFIAELAKKVKKNPPFLNGNSGALMPNVAITLNGKYVNLMGPTFLTQGDQVAILRVFEGG